MSVEYSRFCASKATWLVASRVCASSPMFVTFTETRQNTPAAWVETGAVPRAVCEQSTLVTVNSNLPSRAGWLRPTACAESDDESPPEAGDCDELSPPPA